MFNRETKTLSLEGKNEPVVEFVVWWQTPFGLFDSFEEARRRVAVSDMDIWACLKPVTVAKTETLYEVIGG